MKEYKLTKDQTNQWKIVLAFMVILHHWESTYHAYTFTVWLQYIGYIAVGGFFFISGYGLMSGNQPGKMKKRICMRFINILVPYLSAAILYGILSWLRGEFLFKEYVLNLFSFHPSFPNGWYVLAIMIFYIFFYVARFLFKGNSVNIFIFVFLMQIIYVLLLWKLGYGGTWYRSCLCFSAGIMWKMVEEHCNKVLSRWRIGIGLVLAGLFGVSMVFVIIPINITGVNLLACEVSAILFCLLCILGCYHIKTSQRLLKLSVISYELYLIHGCILDFGKAYIPANVMLILLIPCTIALAGAMHYVNSRMICKRHLGVDKIKIAG